MERCLARIAASDKETLLTFDHDRPPSLVQQMERSRSYVEIGRRKVHVSHRRKEAHLGGELEGGYYYEPTVLKATTQCASSKRRSLGRCSRSRHLRRGGRCQARHDTLYGLGAACGPATETWPIAWGVPSSGSGVDQLLPPLPGRCRFWWLQISGVGRENHQMMLEHYSQTKNLLVSYGTKPLGFF